MRSQQKANVSLGIIAFLAFVLWRIEVEWHGWTGLVWTGYFHQAVPAGIALFLAWCWVYLDTPSTNRKNLVLLTLVLFALVATPLTERSLKIAWSPFGFFAMGPFWPVLFWWLLSPTIVVGILRAFRISVSRRRWVLGQTLFVLAWPLATLLIHLLPQHGHTDEIHAFKSGLVAPFLLFALGITIPTRQGTTKT